MYDRMNVGMYVCLYVCIYVYIINIFMNECTPESLYLRMHARMCPVA
jgi:hypothetical protein